jgi:hypothetical protein
VETKRYEVRINNVLRYPQYEVTDTKNGSTVACFFESGLKDAKTWAEWVCKQLNGDVGV